MHDNKIIHPSHTTFLSPEFFVYITKIVKILVEFWNIFIHISQTNYVRSMEIISTESTFYELCNDIKFVRIKLK